MSRILDATAPATRLAALRIVVGTFVVVYLVGRLPVFLALGDRPAADFDGVGVLAPLGSPPSAGVLTAVAAAAFVSGIASTLGWRYRPNAVVFAVAMLFLTTLRGSWGQLLHFENLMVLQLVVLAASPAAEAWSLDARRAAMWDGPEEGADSARYGWPLAVVGLVTITTYVVTGIAKLRYGGLGWMSGDTLQNHIAYTAARLDLLGGNPAVFAEFAVRQAWILGPLAAGAVIVELSAPVVLLGRRCRNIWVIAAWLMHVGIFLTMAIGFPSPLFGVAFAPFFALERAPAWLRRRVARDRPALSR
ncbi:MAG: HTTM domain-containing protein [Ilumatobacter sp.]|uniref:HTTM domain-containing protein n=1 Tax=Ilumatobacter sp. TaxID=1967498 RepID=UPI003297FCFE